MRTQLVSFLRLFKPADHRTDPNAAFKNQFKLYGGFTLAVVACQSTAIVLGTVSNIAEAIIHPKSEAYYDDIRAENRINRRDSENRQESEKLNKKLDQYMSERGLK